MSFLRDLRQSLLRPVLLEAEANAARTSAIESRLASLESALNQLRQRIDRDDRHFAMVSAGLAARAARLAKEVDDVTIPEAAVTRPIAFEDAIGRLAALRPAIFPVWWELFENGARSYVEERHGSCSHREHRYALLFAAYLEIYAHGRILDVGCGPHGIPSYLATRDPRRLHGLEPLPMAAATAFAVERGFNEFLPWADGQFDAIVSGTSLDHVLSLEASLSEVRRVLKPKGKYLVWLASIAGAAPLDETAAAVTAIDRFHLFHFDRAWIEPLFERYFTIDDVTVVDQPGFDHVFYCMSPLLKEVAP